MFMFYVVIYVSKSEMLFVYIPGRLYFLIGLVHDQFIMTVAGVSFPVAFGSTCSKVMMYALSKN